MYSSEIESVHMVGICGMAMAAAAISSAVFRND